jgi:hypothetical protein
LPAHGSVRRLCRLRQPTPLTGVGRPPISTRRVAPWNAVLHSEKHHAC